MRYSIELAPAVSKAMRKLSRTDHARVLTRIKSLADNPRPEGVVKLSGSEDTWRVRVGSLRIVYTIRDDRLIVRVVQVAHRREVYR